MDILIYILAVIGAVTVCGFAFLVCTSPADNGFPGGPMETPVNWRAKYAAEQERCDRMHRLLERQREIENWSPAARVLEQRSIDTEAKKLTEIV